MKKLYVLLSSLLLVVLFTSCKKEYIPVNGNTNQTILIPVNSIDWESSDYGVTYSVSLNVPEITYNFNQTGEVLVYISYDNNVYEQIPEVYGNTSYSFTHSPGTVSLYAQNINRRSMLDPGDITVKIVLVDSN